MIKCFGLICLLSILVNIIYFPIFKEPPNIFIALLFGLPIGHYTCKVGKEKGWIKTEDNKGE